MSDPMNSVRQHEAGHPGRPASDGKVVSAVVILIMIVGFLFIRVLGWLLPLFAIALGLTILGAGNPLHGLAVLVTLLLIAAAWRTDRRRRRAEQAAAAQVAFIQAQAEANAEAMFRLWERQQYQRELADAPPGLATLVTGRRLPGGGR